MMSKVVIAYANILNSQASHNAFHARFCWLWVVIAYANILNSQASHNGDFRFNSLNLLLLPTQIY